MRKEGGGRREERRGREKKEGGELTTKPGSSQLGTPWLSLGGTWDQPAASQCGRQEGGLHGSSLPSLHLLP